MVNKSLKEVGYLLSSIYLKKKKMYKTFVYLRGQQVEKLTYLMCLKYFYIFLEEKKKAIDYLFKDNTKKFLFFLSKSILF